MRSKGNIIKPTHKTLLFRVLLLSMCLLFSSVFFNSSYADETKLDSVCTNDPDGGFTITAPTKPAADGSAKGKGIISDLVYDKIKPKLDGAAEKLYKALTTDTKFLGAVRAAIVLYITISGILFLTGIIDMKFNDFIIRMFKIGLITIIISPSAWTYFNGTVIQFFNTGTDELIQAITSKGLGYPTANAATKQSAYYNSLYSLDVAVVNIISSKTAVYLLALISTGWYGVIFALLLAVGLYLFMKAVLTALWVFVMSLAMKTLLFGMAPIFIPFLLFERTKHIFDGWLHQVISASLQPLLLFIFFVFFATLLNWSLQGIMQTPVCWTHFPESWRGSPFDAYFWRFMENVDPNTDLTSAANWNIDTKSFKLDDKFPIPIMPILIFLILADITNRFNSIVLTIAAHLASSTSTLVGQRGVLSEAVGGLTENMGSIGKKR